MSLHPQFIAEIKSYNDARLEGLIEALESTSPSVSVRANQLKGIELPKGVNRVKWCDAGWYLSQREAFTFDPAMHQGLYYVQDASSMVLSHIIGEIVKDKSAPIKYLDACAAPGGKTTVAIDALPHNSLVVANEYMPGRAVVLSENVTKWGCSSVVVSKGDTAKYRKLKEFFDIIAADVPCSGEGMFRKDAEAVSQWSPALVDECVARQKEIVENLWCALRPGGYMIYSTCTFNRHEDEEMIDYIINELGAESVEITVPEEWNIQSGVNTSHHCFRFMPHKVDGEGLFVAVVKKCATDENETKIKSAKNKKSNKNTAKPQNLNAIKNWINGKMSLMVEQDDVLAFPTMWGDELGLLKSHLDIVSCGVTVATIKGKDFIPTQSLAMSRALNQEAFPTYELDYNTAISYLRREAIVLDDAPRGYVLLMYKNRPLGFVKNLGNRANNLYPQEWRILSSHIPEEVPQVINR